MLFLTSIDVVLLGGIIISGRSFWGSEGDGVKSYSGVPLGPGDRARPIVQKGLGSFGWSPQPVCVIDEVDGLAVVSDQPNGPPKRDQNGNIILIDPHQLYRLN